MMAPVEFLAPLDLFNSSSSSASASTPKPVRTFSRLAKGAPLNNSSLFLSTQPTISSSPLSAPAPTTTHNPTKVMRFHRSTPNTPVESTDDFLGHLPGCDQTTQPAKPSTFTAHRPLQPHSADTPCLPSPAPLSLSMPFTPLTPSPFTPFKPTFTRITKPTVHTNMLVDNNDTINAEKETDTCTNTSAKSSRGYGFHRASSNPLTPSSSHSSLSGLNNAISPSLLLSGLGDPEHEPGHGRSFSLSSSLSSPTLTPPELSPSMTSSPESSSPPRQLLLPSLDYDWWRKDGSSLSATPVSASTYSSKASLSDGPPSVSPCHHFYSLNSARKEAMEDPGLGSDRDTSATPGPLFQTFKRTEATTPTSEPESSDYIGLLLSGSEEGDEASEHSTDPDDGLSSSSCSSSPSRHGYQTKPKTTFYRSRFPAPPPVLTGFSAVTSKSSVSATPTSCEPSPQDFLGEADLPYPLPSTLQERQARQRKRAEQLKQLQIREEREARLSENRRRMRRRGASFSAGMSLTTPPPAPTTSRPASMSFLTPCINRSTPSLNQIKRSPSSPAKKSGLGSGRPKNCVGFDLRRTKVFEYDASEELGKGSSPQSSGDEGVEEEEIEDDDEEGHEDDYYGLPPSSSLSPDRKNIPNIAEEDEVLVS